MSFDRLHSDKMTITQEQISHLLGVRRETVTQTSSRMQREGLIVKARGSITVLDRTKLEERACECYAAVKKECDRLMPPHHAHD
jgi:Mn-dependent DtxR family transcriptional regulator